MRTLLTAVVLLMGAVLPVQAQDAGVDVPPVVLRGIEFTVSVAEEAVPADSGLAVRVGDAQFPLTYNADAEAWQSEEVRAKQSGAATVEVVQGETVLRQSATRALPGWLSIVPPVLAIAMALAFKRVVPALFLGVWVGAWTVAGFSLGGLLQGLLDAFEVYVLSALANEDHAAIILFSLMIGGMVGIISRNGGTYGVVDRIIGWANTPKRGQVATGIMGIGIFFDDYANTLVVGNTMRPITDRLRISREKLAYIVDSTAAPVACLAFVTTWIGYEVGLVGTAVANIEGLNQSAYSIFLQSIPYSFYPILALFFVFSIANSRRDFGPMYLAEKRARDTGDVIGPNAKVDEAAQEGKELTPDEDTPRRALNAVLPVLALVATVLGGLYITGAEVAGYDARLQAIIGEANSYKALMWGSLIGVVVAAVLSLGQRLLTLEETVEAWYGGLKSMLFAMIILVLAWSLSEITEVLHTASYLTSILGEALPAGTVPAIIFVLAAATAFATGSSWGTMGILMPLVVPLTWAVLVANNMGDPAHYHILYSSVSCVLAGSVWGDHCSPISDTTILSSMASGCDHIEHVRTQLPYAMAVGLVALLIGTLPAGFGFPWWLSFIIGAALLSGAIRLFGTPIDGHDTPPEEFEPAERAASAT